MFPVNNREHGNRQKIFSAFRELIATVLTKEGEGVGEAGTNYRGPVARKGALAAWLYFIYFCLSVQHH
jgi:hypothetical protein